MKKFSFPLNRVLDWREVRLSVAEIRLRHIDQQLHEVRASRASLEDEVTRASAALQVRKTSPGGDFGMLAQYLASAGRERKKLMDRSDALTLEIERQRSEVLNLRKECRLLETLRKTRRAAWQRECDREFDALAADSHQARRHHERAAAAAAGD
jgi:hypothetical protein